MSLKGQAYIAGVYEHPTRKATDKSLAQLHAEIAKGVLDDAGMSHKDVDGYICAAGDAPGLGPINMVDYLGFKLNWFDSTDTGGSSYLVHVEHAAAAIAMGRAKVVLITLAGRPAAEGVQTGTAARVYNQQQPDVQFESPFGPVVTNMYGMAAMRHMHEYGTTSEQLAWVRVAASTHAQYNEHAMRREVVTVEDVLRSPMISDPLHRLDCCVISDGGGGLLVVHPDVVRSLKRPKVKVIGAASAIKGQYNGQVDLTHTAGIVSGPKAFAEAGVKPSDIKYASIYDSFTITVVMQLEDIGFCKKGEGGKFVSDGNLISGVGKLPFNTDGGGLCNNHPGNRGGMTKVIEAVRQLRGEAHPKVQVKNCNLALAHGTGGSIGTRHCGSTLIMERE